MIKKIWLIKLCAHVIALSPLFWLCFLIETQKFGEEPAKDIIFFTGITALRLLLFIALIPLIVRLSKFTVLFQLRKILGLWCFFWAVLHVSSYLFFEIGIYNINLFFIEIFSRTYLFIGTISWFFLFLMTISSLNYIRNWLGVWWKKVHMLLYPTILLVLFHYILSLKTLTPEPFVYFGLVIFVFIYKILNKKLNN